MQVGLGWKMSNDIVGGKPRAVRFEVRKLIEGVGLIEEIYAIPECRQLSVLEAQDFGSRRSEETPLVENRQQVYDLDGLVNETGRVGQVC